MLEVPDIFLDNLSDQIFLWYRAVAGTEPMYQENSAHPTCVCPGVENVLLVLHCFHDKICQSSLPSSSGVITLYS